MRKYHQTWIQEWCDANGWTDLFLERREYWAFPPHAVMPMPIPSQALQLIKSEKGLSPDERRWVGAAWIAGVTGAVLSYVTQCPMPMVAAFAFCAIVVAQFEDE